MQQSVAVWQACPAPVQTLGSHVPLPGPDGMLHEKPEQQSAVEVHTAPCGWHAAGVWHLPAVQS